MTVLKTCLILIFLSSWAFAEPEVQIAALSQRLSGTPLSSRGNYFAQMGSQFGTDPRLAIAIAGAESTFGKHICGANNAWNWFWNGTCKESPFDSWDSGILTVSKFLKKSYLLKGYQTVGQVGSKYCAEGCSGWVPLVTQFYSGMGGDLSDLSYSHAFAGVAPVIPSTPKKKPAVPVQDHATTPATEEKKAPSSHLLLYLLGGFAGLILLGGAAVGAVLLARRGKQAAPTTGGPTTPMHSLGNPGIMSEPALIESGKATAVVVKLTPERNAGQIAGITLMRLDAQGAHSGIVGQMVLNGAGSYELATTFEEATPGAVLLQALIRTQRGTETRTVTSATLQIAVLPSGISFDLPPKWTLRPQTERVICLQNATSASSPAAVLPKAGAQIEIEALPTPLGNLEEAIHQILPNAVSLKIVQTFAGTKANYTTAPATNVTYAHTALFVAQPESLYRFTLTRRAGEAAENEMQAALQAVLDSVRFRKT